MVLEGSCGAGAPEEAVLAGQVCGRLTSLCIPSPLPCLISRGGSGGRGL